MSSIRRIREYVDSHGASYTLRRLFQMVSQRWFRTYERKRNRLASTPEELQSQRDHQPDAGLISVVVPVYNTDPQMLKDLIACLREQTYDRFEAVLYDGCSTREGTREVLQALEMENDRHFHIIRGKENKGISGNTNEAVSFAQGEYVALCDHDDLLTPDALWRVAQCIAEKAPDLVYSDEDKVTENGRCHIEPHYKPDFCPDDLNSNHYISHLSVIRKSLYEEIGGLRSSMDGSQDHDLILRVTEKTDRICHLPYTLYSWREVRASMSHMDLQKCLETGCKAVMEHEANAGRRVIAKPVGKRIRLWYDIPEDVSVEAIIHGETSRACEDCFRELRSVTGWRNLSAGFAVAGNGAGLISEIDRIASESACEYLLLLDAGISGIRPDLIRELLMYAQRDNVAGVSPILTDRKGRITHGGYAVGVDGIAQCVNEGLRASAGGWHDLMNKTHNVSAVSLGCMMVRKDIWLPLDEAYHGAFAMIDLGLRQRRNGKWFVITPHATAVLEPSPLLLSSKKRGTKEISADMKLFEEKWGKKIYDPCYSSRFRRDKANCRF